MDWLRKKDSTDRLDRSTKVKRLRQIPAETGKFLAMMAIGAPKGTFLEVGTSGGYSTLWLSLACREIGTKLHTHEIDEDKFNLAAQTFKAAEVTDMIVQVLGDATKNLSAYNEIAFCFLDTDKEFYQSCYDTVIPRMCSGGILIADNAISHQEELQPFIDRVHLDDRVDALVVPIGMGELVCRKI
jgi:predicted O-methyltransferase YrrM